jgi:1,2-diacylglycerol 3-alpha-glucosyltransferase
VNSGLKIAILFDDLTISGGGQRQLLSLARELTNLGHRVTVFAAEYDPAACYPDLCRELDIRAVTTVDRSPAQQYQNWVSRGGQKVHEYFIEPGLIARLAKERFDILNPHERSAHRAAVYLKKKWGTPIVWMFNDPGSWEINYYDNGGMPGWAQRLKPLWLRRQERSLVRHIDAVTVLSHGVQAIFHREFGVYPHVVRSGIDKEFLLSPGGRERMRDRLQIGPESMLALFLGVLSPSRRIQDLMRAVGLVRATGRDVKLAVVGSSRYAPEYLSQLKTQAEQLGIVDHVKFISYSVSEEERRDLYYACDVFVWPNEAQSWGLAPLEAMLCGKPVVVSIGAGVHEVLRDGENALLVPPRRPDLLVKAITRLVDDAGLRNSIAKSGAAFALANFSWPQYAAQMVRVFEQVVQPPSV